MFFLIKMKPSLCPRLYLSLTFIKLNSRKNNEKNEGFRKIQNTVTDFTTPNTTLLFKK